MIPSREDFLMSAYPLPKRRHFRPTLSSLNGAAFRGDLAAVRDLLDVGANVNAIDEQGWTPLLRAVQRRRFDVARLLIDAGASVTARDRRGRDALYWAASYGAADIVSALLDRGASSGRQIIWSHTSPLRVAIRDGQIEVVDILLRRLLQDETDRVRISTVTAILLQTIPSGRRKVVRRILQTATDLYGKRRWCDERLLEIAAGCNRADLIQILIDHGADTLKDRRVRDSAMAECMKLAATGADTQTVRDLLEHHGVIATLSDAIVAGDLPFAKRLVDAGGDVESLDILGSSLLEWAAERGCTDAARFLIAHGANVNHRGYGDQTPVMLAAATGDLELVRSLIDHGANPEIRVNDSRFGDSALSCAARQGRSDVVRWLLSMYGCAGTKDRALAAAGEGNHIDLVRLLLDEGADVDAGDGVRTALCWAAINGNVEMATLLRRRGATRELGDAVDFAASRGKAAVLRVLLEWGADQSAKDHALCWALLCGRQAVIPILLASGADPNYVGHPSTRGSSAMVAAAQSTPEIVRLLLENGADPTVVDQDGRNMLEWAGNNPIHGEAIIALLSSGTAQNAGADC
jgi:ankyrin repeat protein